MTLEEQKLLDLFSKMNSNLETLTRQGSMSGVANSTSGPSAGSSALDHAAQEKYEREVRLGVKSLRRHNKATQEVTSLMRQIARGEGDLVTAQQRLIKSVNESSDVTEHLITEYNRIARMSIPEQMMAFKNLVKGSDSLTSSLSAAHRNASLLTSSLIKQAANVNSDINSLDYARYISQLESVAENLPDAVKRSSGLFEKLEDGVLKFKENLTADDFSVLNVRAGEAGTALREATANLGSLGFTTDQILAQGIESTLGKLASSTSAENIDQINDATAAISDIALKLLQQGNDFGPNSAIQAKRRADDSIDIEATAAELQKNASSISKELDEFFKKVNVVTQQNRKLAEEVSTFWGKIARTASAEGRAIAAVEMLKPLATFAGTMGALKKLADSLVKIYGEAAAFNIAHVPASFMQVQLQSIKMGMSFEETTKFLQENKRVFAAMGPEAFGIMRSGMEDTFNQFGYTFKQAAEIIGPATEAAIASGINIKDSNALNKYMNDTMTSFSKISGIVNVSAAEYAKLNHELASSPDIMNHMLGMTAQQATAYQKSLEQQRNELVVRGLSLQQAQELIKAQESQKRAKVLERYKASAMQQLMGGIVGMSSAETSELATLTRKTSRVGNDAVRYEELSRKFAAGLAQYETQARNTDNDAALAMVERMREQMPAFQTNINDAQAAGVIADRANTGLIPEEAARTQALQAGNVALAEFGDAINGISSFLKNSLALAGGAAALSLVALNASSLKAAISLGKLAGGGGSMFSGLGKGLGRIGRAVKGVPLAKIGALGLAAGGIAGLASGTTASKEEGGGLWSSVLSGAATGAGIGMFGGLKGAAFLGALGGLAGGATHLFRNRDSASVGTVNSESLTVADPVNNEQTLQAPNGILSVKDAEAQAQLVIIAQQITEAVKILSEIANPPPSASITSRRSAYESLRPAIPTSTAYASGRAM